MEVTMFFMMGVGDCTWIILSANTFFKKFHSCLTTPVRDISRIIVSYAPGNASLKEPFKSVDARISLISVCNKISMMFYQMKCFAWDILPRRPRMAAIVLNRGYISADAIESFHLPGKAANETVDLARYLIRNISSDRTSYLSCCKQRLMRS